MGRRGGVISALNQLARTAAREARRAERAAARVERDRERARKAASVAASIDYIEQRKLGVEALNIELQEQVTKLETILEGTFAIDDKIAFDSLRVAEAVPEFTTPHALAHAEARPVETSFINRVQRSTLFGWLPWVAKADARNLENARAEFTGAIKSWEERERRRQDALHRARVEHAEHVNAQLDKARKNNVEVDRFESEYRAGGADALVAYNSMVLERSAYPEPIESDFELSYFQDAGELAVDYALPHISCVPTVSEYKFVKSKDTIDEKPRRPTQVRALYQDIVVAICLRTLHEVFEADHHGAIRSVVFNGYVAGVDPATGQDAERCLIAVRARRQAFETLNLRRVEKLACLEKLGGEISSRPDELAAVSVVPPYGAGGGEIETVEEPSGRKSTGRGGRA
jgi:restriction system protein